MKFVPDGVREGVCVAVLVLVGWLVHVFERDLVRVGVGVPVPVLVLELLGLAPEQRGAKCTCRAHAHIICSHMCMHIYAYACAGVDVRMQSACIYAPTYT